MDRLATKHSYTRKAGDQVPKHITRLMRMRHPTVSILWDNANKKWCLVQNCRGQTHFITFLAQGVTLANTVYYLDSIHPTRLSSKWARERFLADLDKNATAAAVSNVARDMVRDGSSDLFNALTNRKVFGR